MILLSGYLLGMVFGCLGAFIIGKVPEAENQSNKSIQTPVRRITITIDNSQQDKLISSLRKFVDKWGYALRIAPRNPGEEDFIVEMWRIDMKLIGSYSNDTGTLKLDFYNTDPQGRMPWWFFDDELKDLRRLIDEIPNSTFTVNK